MENSLAYQLSLDFSPPTMDLRQACILDSHGDESWCAHPIDHRLPNDVSHKDLNAYPDVFAFMGFSDLLFYLYPVALHAGKDSETAYVDFFLCSLDGKYEDQLPSSLDLKQRQGIIEALKWLQSKGELDQVTLDQCTHLKALLQPESLSHCVS